MRLRSVPWVAGCCGPKLMIIRLEPRSPSSSCSISIVGRLGGNSMACSYRPPASCFRLPIVRWPRRTSQSFVASFMSSLACFPGVFREVIPFAGAGERVVLPERVARVIVGQHEALQARMPLELDAVEVVHLALGPRRGLPQPGRGVDDRVLLGDPGLHAEVGVVTEREEDVDD